MKIQSSKKDNHLIELHFDISEKGFEYYVTVDATSRTDFSFASAAHNYFNQLTK